MWNAAVLSCATVIGLSAPLATADRHADPSAATDLPITEVTAFKDGHTLVLRAGKAATNRAGDVVLGELPRPIMGTFWVDENEGAARLASVTASRIESGETRPVGTVADLVRANVGREVVFRDAHDEVRRGRITEIIERTFPEPERPLEPEPMWNGYQWYTPPATHAPARPAPQHLVLIETDDGVAALPIGEMRDLRFTGDAPATTITEAAEDDRLNLDLDWQGPAQASAEIAIMHVERGLRWIPSYRVTLLEGDRARLELQATLVNELADLDAVTLHMAIGVPSFAFDHTPDPMGLRDGLADLGRYFQTASPGQTGGMLSNAVMAQTARMRDSRGAGAGGGGASGGQPTSPTLTGGERAEDLYVFTVSGVTLAKGARMVLPLVSYEIPAKSVYTLDLPASPPVQTLRNFNNDQQRELARLLSRPNARHIVRLTNSNDAGYPITTAPAMIVRDGRTLAQGLMTYAAPGSKVDLEVGVAVDIAVDTEESETGQEPKAMKFNGSDYVKLDIAFEAELTNRKPHAVTLEVTKRALGRPETVSDGGEMRSLNMFAEDEFWSGATGRWWGWYNWPWWWHRVNGAAEFTWKVELEAGASADLTANWHYFWN